jgi:hypothetical protein
MILPFAMPGFVLSWWKALVGFIVAAPLFFLLGQCDGKKIERSRADAARAEANVQAMKTNTVASELAAAERVNDALTVSKQEEELIDAIESTPDTAPDAVRVALGCQRLRAQGAAANSLPASCGPSR